jgi:hypothetical protein
MKKLFFVSGILMLSCYAMGQARDGTADLKKSGRSEQAVMIDLPYAPAVVQAALNDYLSKTTNKEQKTATGFLLSHNTLLVKNNIKGADMVFVIGPKGYFHPNETEIYLKLNSNVQSSDDGRSTENHFDISDAKSYLENLSVAIKPYATGLQLKLQKKDLKNLQEKSRSLATQDRKLEENRMKIVRAMSSDNTDRKNARLLKRKISNMQEIDVNMAAKVRNNKEVDDQITALALLENTIKFNRTN